MLIKKSYKTIIRQKINNDWGVCTFGIKVQCVSGENHRNLGCGKKDQCMDE